MIATTAEQRHSPRTTVTSRATPRWRAIAEYATEPGAHRSPDSASPRSSCNTDHCATNGVAIPVRLAQLRRVGDEDAGCQRQHFVEVTRVYDDARARCRDGAETCVDGLRSPNVETASRVLDHEECGRSVELARQHQFLLVAARQFADVARVLTATNVELLAKVPRSAAHAPPRHSTPSSTSSVQRYIFGQGEIQHQCVSMPVLGHETDDFREMRFAARDRHSLRENAKQLAVSRPLHCRDTNDLT